MFLLKQKTVEKKPRLPTLKEIFTRDERKKKQISSPLKAEKVLDIRISVQFIKQ